MCPGGHPAENRATGFILHSASLCFSRFRDSQALIVKITASLVKFSETNSSRFNSATESSLAVELYLKKGFYALLHFPL